MKIIDNIVEGVFIEENKNRFSCKVVVDSKLLECYVPSASKLKNYLNMKDKKVLLLKNKKSNARTQYSIFAIMYYNRYIILNLSIANRIVEEHLSKIYNGCDIKRERYIENYKADFLVCGERNIIVEAKGIIAPRREVQFPSVYSHRAIDQLESIYQLLKKGWEVQYYLISLSPIVNKIYINNNPCFERYVKLLHECIDEGMTLSGFNIYYEKNEIKIGSKVNIIL